MHEIESKDGRYGNKSTFRMVKIPTDPELQKESETGF